MRAMLCTFTLVLSTTLAGCAGSPVRALSANPAALPEYTDATVCQAYHLAKSEKIRTELQTRNALTPDEWQAVDAGKIYVGMSALAALCSWGAPDRVNTTAVASGKSYQFVYGIFGVPSYVYVERGEVVAFQN